ncbi:SLC34A1, partial [Symbiodinium pilosum]
ERAAALSKCIPGQRVAAYFNDDGMYHERILLWRSHEMVWGVLTPDLDVYLEDFSGYGEVGCDSFKIKGSDFNYWSRVGGPAYRFSEVVPDEKLKESIGEIISQLGDSVHSERAWQIRQASAYLLATNSSASFRWLPSELNSSDEPSRLYDSAPSKLLADQIPRPSHATGQTEDPASRRKFGSQSSKARAKETAGASEDTSNQQEKPDFDFGNECTEKQQAVNQQGFRPQSSSPRAALATEPKEANRDADRQQLKRQPVSVPRERVLAPRRRARRSSTMVTNFFQDNSSLLPATRLERQAVSSSTQASYQAELERFMKYAQRHQLDTNLGEAMDNSLVQHMNALYRQGFQSYHGDRLMASVMHRHPSCGRLGNVKMLAQTVSGPNPDAYPLAVWCGVVALLFHWGLVAMAVFVMVAISSYARPIFNCKKRSLIKPASHVTRHWSLLLAPEEDGAKLFANLVKGDPNEPL